MSGESKWAYFRQSSWMILATGFSGVFMMLVLPIASTMPEGELSIFVTLLRLFLLLSIPAAGLQTVFAQLAARVAVQEESEKLAASIRGVLVGSFGLWLGIVAVVWIMEGRVLQALRMESSSALWVTVLIVLLMLWWPMFQGVLQGLQIFSWLGWSLILNGVTRLGAMILIVGVLKGKAAGAMTAALIGFVVAITVCIWPLRGWLKGGGLRLEWRPWLARVLPLTGGVGAMLFIMNADMIIVRAHFGEGTADLYAAAAMVGFALVTFGAPLALVMFPKVVRSVARAEKTNVLALTLALTGAVGGIAAVVFTIWPVLPLRVLYFSKPDFWEAAPLVPWFAWCILPVMMGNILVSNLLARARFWVVPWLVVIVIVYGLVQVSFAQGAQEMEAFDAFRRIIQHLGLFSLTMLLTAIGFTLYEGPVVEPQS